MTPITSPSTWIGAMMPGMKQSTLEPGVLQGLQCLALLQVVGLFIRRSIGLSMSIEVPLGEWLALTLFVPLVLLVLTWVPWWRRKLGSAFLPLILVIASTNIILEKYLTLVWFVKPAQQELEALLLMVNLWIMLLVITILVAWQYRLKWVLLAALLLSLADGALSVPFTRPGSPLYGILLFLFATRTSSVTIVALIVGWLMARQRAQQQALAAANYTLARYAATTEQLIASQERNRLARELHDTLAHSLSGVTVQLEAVQALWTVDIDAAHTMLDNALRSTRSGLTEARRALQALRASPLEDLGLALAVSTLAESLAARAGLKLDVDVQHHLDHLAPEVEQCVYRVAQEALTNVARHADARSLHVGLTRGSEYLTLRIADDGHGFDPLIVHETHFGLKGLRERAELIGGRLDVDSRPGQGTTVRLDIRN
jgi:signal transduction histidine kinase